MKCRHAKKLIFVHIDGMISDSDSLGLERHLEECPQCEATARGMMRSLDMLHKLPPIEPDENFNWKLRLRIAREKNAFRTDMESERTWLKAWNKRFAVSALSTFAFVLIAGFVLVRSSFGPDVVPTRFELHPEEMPKVAADSRKKQTMPGNRVFVPGGGLIGPVLVGTGQAPEVGLGMARGREPQTILDADSLKMLYVESRREADRIRRLEQQIELLHGELDRCVLERNE